ncbi:hypothetical protein EDB86DRAFT_2059328 [Lactarius hatsudake]|nr:hypothetical protein EDB86DRAFT_2059328 [Lactarius hatsudake]
MMISGFRCFRVGHTICLRSCRSGSHYRLAILPFFICLVVLAEARLYGFVDSVQIVTMYPILLFSNTTFPSEPRSPRTSLHVSFLSTPLVGFDASSVCISFISTLANPFRRKLEPSRSTLDRPHKLDYPCIGKIYTERGWRA